MAKSYTELVNEVEGLKIWRKEAERIAAEMSQWIKRCGDLERELEKKTRNSEFMEYDRSSLVFKIEQLEKRILELQSLNKELEYKLRNTHNKKRKLEEVNEHLRAQERQCVAWNKELREEASSLATRVGKLEDENSKLLAKSQSQARIYMPYEIAQLEDKILDLEITNKELKYKLSEEAKSLRVWKSEVLGNIADLERTTTRLREQMSYINGI